MNLVAGLHAPGTIESLDLFLEARLVAVEPVAFLEGLEGTIVIASFFCLQAVLHCHHGGSGVLFHFNPIFNLLNTIYDSSIAGIALLHELLGLFCRQLACCSPYSLGPSVTAN